MNTKQTLLVLALSSVLVACGSGSSGGSSDNSPNTASTTNKVNNSKEMQSLLAKINYLEKKKNKDDRDEKTLLSLKSRLAKLTREESIKKQQRKEIETIANDFTKLTPINNIPTTGTVRYINHFGSIFNVNFATKKLTGHHVESLSKHTPDGIKIIARNITADIKGNRFNGTFDAKAYRAGVGKNMGFVEGSVGGLIDGGFYGNNAKKIKGNMYFNGKTNDGRSLSTTRGIDADAHKGEVKWAQGTANAKRP